MKIIVLIPSREYKLQAGARIRYGRLAEALAAEGASIELTEIDRFAAETAACDVVVVSKCFDARALVAAAVLRKRRVLVGVDLFDDYFSDRSDSRLARYRTWLGQMLRLSDFAICSTAPIAATVAQLEPSLPMHIVSDPAPAHDIAALQEQLALKAAQARASRKINLCWFGIGDNPYFTVGLADVDAFRSVVAKLTSADFAVELTVSTNRRALSSQNLASIARLPVPDRLEEWTEEREASLLRRSFACFLPVNAQPFSSSKSLNRAVTALLGGCQILSAGYPLYAALHDFIYRSPDDLIADLLEDRLKLSATSVQSLDAQLSRVASPLREASALAAFLRSRIEDMPRDRDSGTIYLVHGVSTNHVAHDRVQAAGGITVGTPLCSAPLDFDVVTWPDVDGSVTMLASDKALRRTRKRHLRKKACATRIGRRKFWRVDRSPSEALQASGSSSYSLPVLMATHHAFLVALNEGLQEVFGEGTVILSEGSSLPFGEAR
jgi:hypothetical protein